MRQLFTLCFIVIVSAYASAQVMDVETLQSSEIKQDVLVEPVYKLQAGESITLSPNPVPSANPIIQIAAINVEIYSYHVFTSTGQIVEIENLSGRPDPNYIILQTGIHVGTYIIKFETDSGIITRKFQVF